MSRKKLKIFILALTAFCVFLPGRAQRPEPESVVKETITVTKVYADSTIVTRTFTDKNAAERFANSKADSPIGKSTAESGGRRKMSAFMMGAELGTGLDLSGSDLSTFNVDFLFGYRGHAVQFFGFTCGIHKSLGTRDSFIPLQVMLRTGFIPRPTLCFMQAGVGYSFNTVSSSPMFGDVMATIGAGVNLVQRPKFQSNIALCFGFRHFSERHQALTGLMKPNVGFVQISMGISM